MITKQRIAKEWLIFLGFAVFTTLLISVVAATQVFLGNIPKGLYLYTVMDRIAGGWIYIDLFLYAGFQSIRLTIWSIKTVKSKEM